MVDRIRFRLNALDRAKELRDVNLPGFDFHQLKGDRKGEFAIKITKNYRITFKFEDGQVIDVGLEDYHEKGRLSVMAERKKKLPPTHPGELLREEIVPAAGLTQERLAKLLGVSRSLRAQRRQP